MNINTYIPSKTKILVAMAILSISTTFIKKLRQ